MQLCGSSKPSSLWREVSRRWKRTVNRDEYYLPEVCHGSRKWALWGDVSRVARVMVHLGEKEQSVTQCLGADCWTRKPRLCKNASIKKPPSGCRNETFASASCFLPASFINSASVCTLSLRKSAVKSKTSESGTPRWLWRTQSVRLSVWWTVMKLVSLFKHCVCS